ncbi:MAG: hypothetical protein ACMUIG_04185 [Thermoplasmatota archaeon]
MRRQDLCITSINMKRDTMEFKGYSIIFFSVLLCCCLNSNTTEEKEIDNMSEMGNVLFIKEYRNGLGPQFHHFIIITDTKEIYDFAILCNTTPMDHNGENHLNEVDRNQLFSWIVDEYYNEINYSIDHEKFQIIHSNRSKINDLDYLNLIQKIEDTGFRELNSSYSYYGLSCCGWLHFTTWADNDPITISIYYSTMNGPEKIHSLNLYIDYLSESNFNDPFEY